ncbi:MAG: metallophosphoesterase family protein [Nanoarchaeota archaeon]|nr:metallophosphoesterase family protein [Nanoarchaeota archaeon]MBU1644516.1 metallophosphoesterase family protein [Nanoarchaeota archaeon]MBU1976409.1 metallophosphoesterase family protein [Nanoarchaeota archaeon]
MKFLTFTDLHADKTLLKELVSRASKEDIDFLVCCGDISIFGKGLRHTLKELNSLNKKVYVLPGNHESDEMMTKAVADLSNCENIHRKAVEIDDYIFLGYGEDGFSQKDPEFRKISREWYGKYNGRKIVLVTHGPAYGTKADRLEKTHAGNIDYRNFVERIKPKLMISGHLHETVGAVDTIGKTKVINPGWEGMVIELK